MRWCWNWQTGMVEGHMPLGRAGSIPAQRTENRLWAVFFILLMVNMNISFSIHTAEDFYLYCE